MAGGEILLGARRPPRSRRLAGRALVAAALVLLTLVVAYVVFHRATTYNAPEGTAPNGRLHADGSRLSLGTPPLGTLERLGKIWILRAAGAPFALGYTQARLLGELARADEALDAAVLGEKRRGGLAGLWSDAGIRWRLRLLADGIPAWAQGELAGFAEGLAAAGAGEPSFQRLVWRQSALDVGQDPAATQAGYAPPGGLVSGLAAVLPPPAGGHLLVARTLTRVPMGEGTPPPPLVSILRPAGKLAFVRVGWPGEVGALTGVNAERLVVIVNPAIAEDVRAETTGTPVALLGRQLLEEAHGLDEALALLGDARPLGAASFLLIDGETGSWAVVERTPGRTATLRPKQPWVVGDLFQSGELAKDAENDRARRTRPGLARGERLRGLLPDLVGKKGPGPDAAAVAGVLRDRAGAGGTTLPLGNGNALDDLAQAHAVVLDVTDQVLWVSEGPGAAGRMVPLDLLAELGGQPARTLAPIAEDATLDREQAEQLKAARREYAAAARLARAGAHHRAEEHAARAGALAPSWAPPHKLAGDLALSRRDEEAARAHYRRFLELTPADPGAAEEVRAFLGVP